jgi:hypothetical protein
MIFAALRLHAVLKLDFLDVTYSQVGVVLYGTLEPAVAIVVSSSVLLKPAFDACFQSFFSFGSDRQISESSGPSAVASAKRDFGAKPKSRSRATGFSQVHEREEDELELNSVGKKERSFVVSAKSAQSMDNAHNDTSSQDGSGSDRSMRINAVNTFDETILKGARGS